MTKHINSKIYGKNDGEFPFRHVLRSFDSVLVLYENKLDMENVFCLSFSKSLVKSIQSRFLRCPNWSKIHLFAERRKHCTFKKLN